VSHLATAFAIGPRQAAAAAFGVAVAVGVGLYACLRRRPDAEEIERQRRLFLATQGRITDAMLIDTPTHQGFAQPSSTLFAPETLQYQYRVAGVIYESSQDVSGLSEYVRNVRIDLPIQVRYDTHNPGNSIVVAESWSGLRAGK
jgi:hypothetical protein